MVVSKAKPYARGVTHLRYVGGADHLDGVLEDAPLLTSSLALVGAIGLSLYLLLKK